jgi:hypothetical protein
MNKKIKNARKLVDLFTMLKLETNPEMIEKLNSQILETQKKIAGVK